MNEYGEVIIYQTDDGLSKIEVNLKNETVWLSIDQMAELFQRDRSVIGKHVRNIFKEGELIKDSVWAKFAYTATDGKEYNVDFYNLDVIICLAFTVDDIGKEYEKVLALGATVIEPTTQFYKRQGRLYQYAS